MYFWIGLATQHWKATAKRRREAAQLDALPEYLLYDMGLSRDGVPSLARQLRPEGDR
jgi:uncharacterized protein YjiS (DUF1127 family)